MEHAWLDSLSEDWPSSGPSDTSAAHLPPLTSTRNPESSPSPSPSHHSRIPRMSRGPGAKQSLFPSVPDTSISILSERNANDINIARQRLAAKPLQGDKASGSAMLSRSFSNGSNGSVVHHTTSPSSGDGAGTPEWKRRLVYGDIQYGEHLDLFSSAATGLQDMFKPPQPTERKDEGSQAQTQLYDMTMPSSPPLPRTINTDFEEMLNLEDDDDVDYSNQVTPSPSPRRPQREIRYKLNVDDSLNDSIFSNEAVRPVPATSQPPGPIFQGSSSLNVPLESNSASRKISGDTHNEHFSPILLGKHNDEDGKIDFAPLEMPAEELRQRLERLRLNQMLLDASQPNDEQFANAGTSGEYVYRCGSVNISRAKSDEASSHSRALSPDIGVDSSEMFPEESLQASTPKQYPTVRSERVNAHGLSALSKSPLLPRVPFPSPEKRQVPEATAEQPGSSPLKLFGPYDTFTNQTLLRRISQFEEGNSFRTSRRSSVQSMPDKVDHQYPSVTAAPQSRSFSQFGRGDLEGYEFSGDLSNMTHDDSGLPRKENISPTSPRNSGVKFHYASPDSWLNEELKLKVRRRRQKSLSRRNPMGLIPPNEDLLIREILRSDSGFDKRPRTSPVKDPTPKRRRTLHRSDIAYGNENRLVGVDSGHRQSQASRAKKGKDGKVARYTDVPRFSRSSSIFRPRMASPSPEASPRRGQQMAMSYTDAYRKASKSPRKIIHDPESVSPKQLDSSQRKPSIRTQDFVDQAAQIMAMIRNQVSQPGLTSLLESDGGTGLGGELEAAEEVSNESTSEPLSRPPSREGKSVSWLPQRQDDPELLSRLKKYQELSDFGDVISSSMRSMGLAKDAIRAAQEVERMIDETSRGAGDVPQSTVGGIFSDVTKIRMPANSSSVNGSAGSPNHEFHTDTSARSTSQTFPSSSSRGSESRRIIMPESVSHLIPDNVGGMYLDKQNNIWIKRKESQDSTSHAVSYDDSEDDPFASIPDLTVDITKELQQLKVTNVAGDATLEDDAEAEASFEDPSFARLREDCADQARNSAMAARAVGELKKLDSSVERGSAPRKEAEYQHANAQDDGSSNPTSSMRRRNLTISFSSPIASIIQEMIPEDLDSLEDDPDRSGPLRSAAPASPSPSTTPLTTPSGRRKINRMPLRSRNSSVYSPGQRSFIPRPVSRIDERDEENAVEILGHNEEDHQLSVVNDNNLLAQKSQDAGLAFVLNRTPSRKTLTVPGDDSLLIGQNVGRLSLTPLSEFTLNHPDQSFGFEVSYVMGQRHMATGNGSKRVLSMTIRELVDKLAEVEPFEPYWEDMTRLDLHDKQLTSLHMLDEFCGKVTALDASENSLVHLEGIPPCVRHLKVSSNMLTELTSWDHLLNLQYVDISGNEVKSLSALRNLLHLRSLRVDNNRLTSLDGLDSHDGLLSLRARNNLLEELDGEGLKFERLTELDLEGNRIASVRGLEAMPALSQLHLSGNQLCSLTFDKEVHSLRILGLNDNELTSLDIRNLPNLQTLRVDRNRMQELCGLRHVRRLDSLSMREQQVDGPLDLGFLTKAYEVRKLYLSGNYLKSFRPQTDFLNLQILELANCGLEELSEDLGQMMPNLRMLNLNFNAVSNLTPLRFIPRLKKLFVAGNRLVDSTAATELLIDFPHLTSLDLRDNPITQGFYPPLRVLVTAETAGSGDLFTLADSDPERDSTFSRRLDEPTKLRRRLHEVVFVASCKRLRKLDGLAVKRGDVLARDPLLQTLIEEGLVPELEDTLIDENAESESAPRLKEVVPEAPTNGRETTGHDRDGGDAE